MDGVEAKFVLMPDNEKERSEHFHFIFRVWLKEKLGKKESVPNPKIQVVGKGLESVQGGWDILKKEASGVKLVVEI